MGDDLSRAARRVQDALVSHGLTAQVRELPGSTRTAADAAATLGCEVGAIANSLIFMADGDPLLVMTSGAHRVDTKQLAHRIGVGRIARATPEQVRDATGQAIGGVSPVGHPAPIRTVVDRALAAFETVWAAAGTPHAVFPTTFDELVRICDGIPEDVD
ncbi:YbaK/EbsC family protein [Brooklawnia cerclae]|uniref:Prolyl-tRNA editing enzyme YbaK/EbsC (Cys-tRNA(Pro) deacylase) n=1 Tax=Brooklawnia cerclae TaxID=349934 RepID=A0ABX0SLC1_9ACTN|nr:YbaK/EbsC family protein [Brooklawnia cerclae]NIH57532.1 prolyl-tRNA editing enzyme YbaK/EbsC (Cys-tRNA(Pro) deacylase) [Brooklawnia cerclae]